MRAPLGSLFFLENLMRIMIDIDDVLSNFNRKYLEIANEQFGSPLNIEIKHWDFHKSIPGFTREMEKHVFGIIKNTYNFYETLPPYSSEEEFAFLKKLIDEDEHEFYFITSRFKTKGRPVKEQSETWIKKYLKRDIKVFVTRDKGKLCRELQVDFAIDDSPEHIQNLIDNDINIYIMDWAYNRFIKHDFRVNSLAEFLNIIFQRKI
jgi:hypothetical protein